MSRVRAFFVEEATGCLQSARTELARELPDRVTLYRAVRRLRGSAQLARLGGVAREAAALEALLRPGPGNDAWTTALGMATAPGLDRLEAAVDAVRTGSIETMDEMETVMEGEARAEGAVGMDELEYRGKAALERALELRTAVEEAIVIEAPAGPVLDELFDLIRLGMR